MNITMENKKQKAIELMKKLDIYEPYIHGFEKDNLVGKYCNATDTTTQNQTKT